MREDREGEEEQKRELDGKGSRYISRSWRELVEAGESGEETGWVSRMKEKESKRGEVRRSRKEEGKVAGIGKA